MIWFEAIHTSYRERIRRVEIDKATEHTVTRNGRRESRYSNWSSYHPTFEEAKAHLIRRAESAVEVARNDLKRAHDELGNCKGLKEPTGSAS